MADHRLSIIIPSLNEAAFIASTLAVCFAEPDCETIVVDGGSGDGTIAIARDLGARTLSVVGGRGAQLNAGAAAAQAPLLLFLHADTQLPSGFAGLIASLLANQAVALGSFRLAISDATPGERLIAAGANARSRWFGRPYGDQGLFVRRQTWETLGGFACWPILEDYDFVRRAARLGRIAIADAAVTTSNRRWRARGPLATLVINQLMLAGYHLGLPPARLARLYRGKA